jgi:hypothetical protein
MVDMGLSGFFPPKLAELPADVRDNPKLDAGVPLPVDVPRPAERNSAFWFKVLFAASTPSQTPASRT